MAKSKGKKGTSRRPQKFKIIIITKQRQARRSPLCQRSPCWPVRARFLFMASDSFQSAPSRRSTGRTSGGNAAAAAEVTAAHPWGLPAPPPPAPLNSPLRSSGNPEAPRLGGFEIGKRGSPPSTLLLRLLLLLLLLLLELLLQLLPGTAAGAQGSGETTSGKAAAAAAAGPSSTPSPPPPPLPWTPKAPGSGFPRPTPETTPPRLICCSPGRTSRGEAPHVPGQGAENGTQRTCPRAVARATS